MASAPNGTSASFTAFATEAAAPVKIRLATLAPKDTSLHKTLQQMGESWKKSTADQVQLTIYTDGTMGGEADMVRRVRVGQIQAAMLSVPGMSPVEESVRAELGRSPVRVEGLAEQLWVLVDYGDVVVHVFAEDIRMYYEIERLYRDVPKVDWVGV